MANHVSAEEAALAALRQIEKLSAQVAQEVGPPSPSRATAALRQIEELSAQVAQEVGLPSPSWATTARAERDSADGGARDHQVTAQVEGDGTSARAPSPDRSRCSNALEGARAPKELHRVEEVEKDGGAVRGVERAAAELELGTGTSRQGALGVQSGGAQALPEVAGQTLAHARQRMEKLERAKKTHDNLLNLFIELESIAQLCTCADCKAGKRALAEKCAHVPGNDETRDSSPVASMPASGPHPRSALRASSSAAGSAAIGAARRKEYYQRI